MYPSTKMMVFLDFISALAQSSSPERGACIKMFFHALPRRMRLPDADAEASAEQAILEKLEEACNDFDVFSGGFLSLIVKQ